MPFIPLDQPRKATDSRFPRVSDEEQAARDVDAERLVRNEFDQDMPGDSRAALESEYQQRFGKEPPTAQPDRQKRGFFPLANADEQRPARGFIPLAPEESASPSLLKTIALENPATAIGEAALNLGSQALALPVAGLAGLGASAGNALGLTDKTGADVVHTVGEALTYMPRGEMGKGAAEIVSYPFQKLAEAGQWVGDQTLDATGSPIAATVVDTAINALPMVIAPAAKGAKRAMSKPAEVVPRIEPTASMEAARWFIPLEPESARGVNAKAIETRAQRLAGDDPALLRAEFQELPEIRRGGDSGFHPLADELSTVPARHGTGAESGALAGAAGRERQLRTGELPLAEKNLTGKLSPAGAYETARLSRAAASITDGAIRFGYPVRKGDGSFTYSGKGLEEVLRPVAGRLDDFATYAVGRSARELLQQGRENLFSKAEVQSMTALETPEFRKAFAEYGIWNKGVLDFAESLGTLNPETRKLWKRNEYVPFWRVDQGVSGRGAVSGQWTGVKGLKGGTGNLRAPLENIIKNANMLIGAALKNDARAKVVELIETNQGGGRFMQRIPAESKQVKVDAKQVADAVLKGMGIDSRANLSAEAAQVVKHIDAQIAEAPDFYSFYVGGQAPKGSNIVAVMKGGKPEYFEVADPLLLRALTAIDRPAQSWVIKLLGMPKRLGQASIVLDPSFMAANFSRDQVMAGIMTRSGYRPILDAMDGMRRRMTTDPLYRDWVANGGGASSVFLDESKFRANLERFYQSQGIDYRTVIDSPKKFLNLIETFGDAIESGTRVGEFKRGLARGDNPRHAAYKSREVSVDFSQGGDSPAVKALYDVVMFLRTTVVSWDRLYRGVAHDPNRGMIAAKAAMLGLASAGLYLMNRGDSRYDDMPDYLKDSHWHVFLGEKHFMLPKAFEAGAIGSIAERTVEKVLDGDPEGLGKDFARIIANTFHLNLMPQVAAPLVEQYANKNSFTGSPIETPGHEAIQPFLRAKPTTSETLKAAGMATKNLPEALQLNGGLNVGATAEELLREANNSAV